MAEGAGSGHGTGGDEQLAALGIRRLALPVPFPQAGGEVNAYLIDNPDGTLTLFDTGLGSDDGLEALEGGFAAAGRRFDQVSRIIVSHGHADHFGLARTVQERSGAPVFVHRADWNKVLEGQALPPVTEHLARLGASEEQIARLVGVHGKAAIFAPRLQRAEPLEEGTRFRFARFEGEILHLPGHTPGLVCLHAPSHGVVLTDDLLLERVSPNPMMEPGPEGKPYHALSSYLRSARRLYDLDLELVAPGHGAPFRGHRAVLDGLFAFYRRRQDRLAASLAEEPRTAFDLVNELFTRAGGLQLFLMLSEIVGNLEVLEEAGRIERVPGEVPWRYRAVPG